MRSRAAAIETSAQCRPASPRIQSESGVTGISLSRLPKKETMFPIRILVRSFAHHGQKDFFSGHLGHHILAKSISTFSDHTLDLSSVKACLNHRLVILVGFGGPTNARLRITQ